jgi:hypothetical protein
MLTRTWAVLVAGGLVLSASGGRGQEGVPIQAPMGMDPAMMGGDPTSGPCPTCCEQRTIYHWLVNHCISKTCPDDELCPKGHDWKGWLTYRSQSRPCCGWQPCCPPPLYTFFLDPNCGQGMPCAAPGCSEVNEGRCVKCGRQWEKLLFWRHHAKCPTECPGEAPAEAMAVAAPHP